MKLNEIARLVILTRENNELIICRVGPDNGDGQALRRYWHDHRVPDDVGHSAATARPAGGFERVQIAFTRNSW
jgi:hypothetical protein